MRSVQGTFTATAAAADDVGVAGVQFLLDGVAAGGEDTSPPFTATDRHLPLSRRPPHPDGRRARYVRATSRRRRAARWCSTTSRSCRWAIRSRTATSTTAIPTTKSAVTGGISGKGSGRDGITNVNFVGSQANGISTIDRDHEGHGGWRIDDMEAAAGGWLNASQPDIILLFAGANDIIQGYSTSLALSRMSLLLDKIHTFRPSARVIVANLPGARANQDSTFSNVTPAAISAFNSGLVPLINNRAAQGWNISLIDAFGSAGIDRSAASPDYSIDGMHLSLAGYNKLANLWYSALNLGAADAAAAERPVRTHRDTGVCLPGQSGVESVHGQRRCDGLSGLPKWRVDRDDTGHVVSGLRACVEHDVTRIASSRTTPPTISRHRRRPLPRSPDPRHVLPRSAGTSISLHRGPCRSRLPRTLRAGRHSNTGSSPIQRQRAGSSGRNTAAPTPSPGSRRRATTPCRSGSGPWGRHRPTRTGPEPASSASSPPRPS